MSEMNAVLQYELSDKEYRDLLKFLQKYADQMAYEINEMLAEYCYERAKKISKSAIDAFYSGYSPHLYSRTDSLYDIFDIQVSGDDFIFAMDSDLMGWHRSNDAVLELDIIGGFHGGSKWRTPPFPGENGMLVKILGGGYAFATHSWQYWHPAKVPKSQSPFSTIQFEWSTFLHSTYQNLKEQAIQSVVSKYAKMI